MGVGSSTMHRDTRPRTVGTQAGFSVLEAIVAVALIAAAFLPLLALQTQLTRTAIAIERAEANLLARNNALALLQAINPGMRPAGSEEMGAVRLDWTAQALSPVQPARGPAGSPGRFNVALYEIKATLTFDNGREDIFTVRQVGWRATRPAGDLG
ncbi:MAG: hypothetical protein AAGH42_08460 [Pseudomonadota bacterium]